MNIEDKARDTPEVSLARQSAPGAYIVLSTELASADEVTAEGEFPEYGDFLEVDRLTDTDGRLEPAGDERFIECPQGLAKFLVNHGAGEGFRFRIRTVRKVDGEWQYNCEEVEPAPDE